MAPDLPDQYLNGLLNLKSLGAVVLTLAVKKQLSKEGYYWFNLPKKAGFPFLALVEHTNYLSSDYFGGDHILYCGDYLETDHESSSVRKKSSSVSPPACNVSTRISSRIGSKMPGYIAPNMPNRCPSSIILKTSRIFAPQSRDYSLRV